MILSAWEVQRNVMQIGRSISGKHPIWTYRAPLFSQKFKRRSGSFATTLRSLSFFFRRHLGFSACRRSAPVRKPACESIAHFTRCGNLRTPSIADGSRQEKLSEDQAGFAGDQIVEGPQHGFRVATAFSLSLHRHQRSHDATSAGWRSITVELPDIAPRRLRRRSGRRD